MNGAIEGSGVQRYEKALGELNAMTHTHPDEPEILVMRCRVAQGLVERADRPRDFMIDQATTACLHAQMFAPNCRAGMIFVPSVEGISHNVRERTEARDLVAGADVLLQMVLDLSA